MLSIVFGTCFGTYGTWRNNTNNVKSAHAVILQEYHFNQYFSLTMLTITLILIMFTSFTICTDRLRKTNTINVTKQTIFSELLSVTVQFYTYRYAYGFRPNTRVALLLSSATGCSVGGVCSPKMTGSQPDNSIGSRAEAFINCHWICISLITSTGYTLIWL